MVSGWDYGLSEVFCGKGFHSTWPDKYIVGKNDSEYVCAFVIAGIWYGIHAFFPPDIMGHGFTGLTYSLK